MEKAHFEILLEDINSKFNLVLEGHDALRSEIREARDESNSKHEHTAYLLKALNEKIDDGDRILSNKVDEVESNLSTRIDGVESKLSTRIDEVESKLSTKIDEVESKLSTRIDEVETTLASKIDTVADELKAHRADTESHHGIYRVKES